MKRSRESNRGDEAGPSSGRGRSKRSKIQACSSCRKHKTRCEILDGFTNSKVRCHRCKVLNSTCSYETMDKSLFAPDPPASPSGSNVGAPPLDGFSRSAPVTSGSPAAGAPDASLLNEPFPRADFMWSFVPHDLDWSAPMLAIQELCKQPISAEPIVLPAINDQSLANILTQPEVDHHLVIFSAKYAPWMNFTLIHEGATPFLDLVCCTISSRYLDIATRSNIAPRLQKLTEDTIARMIFNPARYESLETIQGLIILSLWSPICGISQSGGRDGKMLISMAVSMAMNMRLNESSALAKGLRDNTLSATPRHNQLNYEVELNKARLWIVLANTESMLCLGSGRKPLSRRSQADIDLIPLSSPTTVSEGRDLRIRLLAEVYNAAEEGMSVQLNHRGEIDSWYTGVSTALASMDRLSRLILPLSVVHDHDKFYYHMLLTTLLSCRHLVLYNAVFLARRLVRDANNNTNPMWYLEIRPHGLNVILTWGKEVLQVAEALLVSILQTDYSLLATSPDIVFTMIAFASGLVVGVKFLVADRFGIELLGSGDKLLDQTIQALSHGSFSEDHAARRCAQVIHSMMGSWQDKRQSSGSPLDALPHIPSPLAYTPRSDSSLSQHSHSLEPPIPELPNFGESSSGISHSHTSASGMGGQDYQGQEFWAHFLGNDSMDYLKGPKNPADGGRTFPGNPM